MPGHPPIVIMAGGTGGHIFPGLAVAKALRARAIPVVWLGSAGGMETRLVPAQGIAVETIAVRGLRGKGWSSWLLAPWALLRALWQARNALRRHRPAAVLSFGGFAAGPGGLAAWLLGYPLLVHEQNRAPGLTNRWLARLAQRVLCGFPGSFPEGAADVVGNPVRPEIAALASPSQRFAERSGALRLLVLGGSQGARGLNLALPRALARVAGEVAVEVRHQCGDALRAETERAYADAGVPARIEPFIQDMAEAYAWADLVVGRAGASTVAELCAAGVGGLLVPYPGAVDDHQARNADYLKDCGGGDWLRQDAQLETALAARLRGLLQDRGPLLVWAEAARAAAFPDAADTVAEIVIKECHR